MTPNTPPFADGQVGLHVLRAFAQSPSPLTALATMQQHLGELFQITLPGFQPIVAAGPNVNRQILLDQRDDLLWRPPHDPVTKLLRHGLLVTDGTQHQQLRAVMEPTMHKQQVLGHISKMRYYTDWVIDRWPTNKPVDMLIAMRQVALLILVGTLFGIDYTPHLDRLWKPTLGIIKFISPGPWVFLPFLSGLGHRQDRQLMDEYFYQLISHRRQTPPPTDETTPDLLTTLVHHTDWDDHLIRDQLITMFIAGHDTSTALLAWTLYLIGCHPQTAHKLHDEIDTVIGSAEPQAHHLPQLKQLDHVIKESLRLYPPIHMGNRMAARDTTLHQCHIPANTRVMYSIYVSQRDANHWDEPHQFCPARFDRQQHKPSTAFSYLPFGGGPRNCIGATFAQIEAKIVLARILQRTKLTLTRPKIRLYMGATLEPRPGVLMSVQSRR